MSLNFSANQYDDAFRPKRLTNWEQPKRFQEMPRTLSGSTKITAADNGRLKPEYRRSKTDPWGTFVGTWDLPKRLPGNLIDVPTARSAEANEKLRQDWEDTRFRLTGQRWGTYNNTFYKNNGRSYAAPMKTRSKNVPPANGVTFGEGSPTAIPRKLSPIERSATSAGQGHATDDRNVTFDESIRANDNKIPLPQLNRSVYLDESDQCRYTIAAL